MPLKSQDDIYAFFEEESGYEFVRFYNENFEAGDRVYYYYYPFQEVCGKGNGITTFPFKIANCFMVAVQKMIKFTRNKDIRSQKGSNWFSITDDLARYVLSKKQRIKKVFFATYCADEIFLQTLIWNSGFKDKLFHNKFDNDMHAIMRLIIWEKNGPHVFTMEDKEMLEATEFLFGRKFDVSVDEKIIASVRQRVLCNQKNWEE